MHEDIFTFPSLLVYLRYKQEVHLPFVWAFRWWWCVRVKPDKLMFISQNHQANYW